jgi:hypothetical protein
MAEGSGHKLDEWGHIETHNVKEDVWVGVLPRQDRSATELQARIVVSIGQPPDRGYDLSFGYKTVEDAQAALQGWDYDSEAVPPDCVRDFQADPIEDFEEK